MLDNAAIAELLVREAEGATGHREQAFRRAAREAFMWPEEAAEIAACGRSLQELTGIGPSLAKRLQGWIETPSQAEPPPIRREFLTLAQARRAVGRGRRCDDGAAQFDAGRAQRHSDGLGS